MEPPLPDDWLFAQRTFNDLDIPEEIRRAIGELGFVRLTRVQEEVLPLTLAGRDVVAQAQTGTGKTATYLITIFTHALRVQRPEGFDGPRAIIIAPTRELAVQVSNDAEKIGTHTGLKTHVVFGGLDYRKQRAELAAGVDVLVGTPGRLIDYYKQQAYSLERTGILVIDECDRLFDMGFAPDLRWILRRMPHPRQRQSMMFTATLSYRVMTLGWREMNRPVEVVINPENITPETITQELYHVSSREKLSLLLGLLEREGAIRTMIFVNTRWAAKRLVEDLQRHGYRARGLTGNVDQRRRLKVLDDFRDGTLPILVATDVASRGLQIDGVTHVINFDLPQDPEDYVHRIGRTARAGAQGKAISLACEDFVYSLDAIQKFIGYEIPVSFAPEELYTAVIPYRRSSAPPASKPRRSSRPKHTRPRTDGPGEPGTKANRHRRPHNRKKSGSRAENGGKHPSNGKNGGTTG